MTIGERAHEGGQHRRRPRSKRTPTSSATTFSKHPRRRRGKSREVIMAPAAPASLTSSPIGRTARNTAELDDRKTGLWRCQDLASATPSRSMLPQSGSTHSWPSSTPTRVSPGQNQIRLSCAPRAHRSRRAACNRAFLDPFSRSRCPKPACRAAVQLVQVPPRTLIGPVGDLMSRLCVVGRRSIGHRPILRNSDGVGGQCHATDRCEQHGEVGTEVLK